MRQCLPMRVRDTKVILRNLRLEGKEYTVKDGDVLVTRHG
jgi:hypothetical protein